MRRFLLFFIAIFILGTSCVSNESTKQHNFFLPPAITYNYKMVDGHKIFYRESGVGNKTTIVLLHGYPSSSHTYRYLIPMLATHFHVIAPDNLGSGYSAKPSPDSLTYTFDLLADINSGLLRELGITDYVMYMQDFGAPVGYRMMMERPSAIKALIVQNANAYLDGLTDARQKFFRTADTDRSPEKFKQLYGLTSESTIIEKQYLFDIAPEKYNTQSPDAWLHDLHFLQSDSDRRAQVQLFQDYNNNLKSYPAWQKMLREEQPKTLIVWGAKDLKFNKHGAEAYLRDVPNAELHLLDAGHFAAEELPTDIARYILEFSASEGLI